MTNQPTPNDKKEPIPARRYAFSGFVILVMLISGAAALGAGLWLAVKTPAGEDIPLGAIALIVAPATTIVATLSTIAVNLLREDRT